MEKKKEKGDICYLSNSVPCLMCTGSNVFWLAFLALFLHKSC